MTYFDAFIDSGHQPAKQTTVKIFGKGISGIVSLQINTQKSKWRDKASDTSLLLDLCKPRWWCVNRKTSIKNSLKQP